MNAERNAINGTILGEPAQCIDPSCVVEGMHDHPEDTQPEKPADIVIPDNVGSFRWPVTGWEPGMKGTRYSGTTPHALAHILEKVRLARTRVRIVYGTVAEGVAFEERGRVGRSMGSDASGIPILVKTSRSYGGEAIYTDMILEVRLSVGGKVIYRREDDFYDEVVK